MASELGGVHRLETAQQYASSSLATLQARMQQLDSFASDYKSLRTRLQSLALRTRHEVMVPLGPLAFQPGYLQRTNELHVLLGDKMVVERSTAQSCDIIQRRLAYLDKQRAGVQARMDNTRDVSTQARRMFGGKSAEGEGDDDPFDPSMLGVQMRDGKLINEEGDDIVEIKEDFSDEEEEQVEEKQQEAAAASSSSASSATASASSSSSTAPSPHLAAASPSTSASAPASSSGATGAGAGAGAAAAPLDFPSVMDQNFDQFWDQLAELEEQEEQQAAAAAAGSAKSSHAATSSAPSASAVSAPAAAPASAPVAAPTAATPAISASDLLDPVPPPPPSISSPADIFRLMHQAKREAGEQVAPDPLTVGPRTTRPAGPAPAAAAATAASSKRAAPASASASASASSSSRVPDPVLTSRSLDAAFSEYKSARASARAAKKDARAQQRSRLAAGAAGRGGQRRVAFADEAGPGQGSSDEDSDEEEVEGMVRYVTPAAAAANQRAEALAHRAAMAQAQPRAAAPAAASSSAPLPRADTAAAFTGQIQERTRPAATVSARPMMAAPMQMHARVAPPATSASAAAEPAAPPRMSKFKAARLGIQQGDD